MSICTCGAGWMALSMTRTYAGCLQQLHTVGGIRDVQQQYFQEPEIPWSIPRVSVAYNLSTTIRLRLRSVLCREGEMQAMALYKYVKFDDLKRILNGTIRFTQPGAFNDPFELVPELYVPEAFGKQDVPFQFSLTAARREVLADTTNDEFEADHCSDQNARSIRASVDQAIGMLCLSRNGSSLLMWSHYADGYSGAVVRFDETHEFFSGQIAMEYRERRPKMHIRDLTNGDSPIPIAEFCVKANEWEYEQEVRVVRALRDCRCVGEAQGFPVYVMDVPATCIESVILGERMSVCHQRQIWELVRSMRNVSLYLYAVSNWGYEFRSEPIKFAGSSGPIMSPRTAHIFADYSGTHGETARWLLENHPLSEMMNHTL